MIGKMAGLSRRHIGKHGEDIAARFLTSRGFSILHRNFATPFGEIDLVAKQAAYIVFVEVKTRISERFGTPLSAITDAKKKHILRNCRYYLARYNLCETPCRIDVVGINIDTEGRPRVLKHVKNAITTEGY
ncbi:MAG: YraN family protein [Candidatus Omnitrophota bacterium]